MADPATPPLAPWRRRMPLVAAGGLLLLLLAVGIQKIWSADFWWQMRTGSWIVQNQDVPTREMYSHTSAGTPIREMRWIYHALIYLAWEHAGPWLLVLAQALTVAAIWTIVIWPHRAAMKSPAAALIVGLGLAAGFQRWTVRPELITYLLTAAFLATLARSGDRKWRGVWLLPLLQVAWVNGHTTFMLGPIITIAWLGADTAQRLLSRRAPDPPPPLNRRLALSAALVVAACWVNPYGHAGAMYAVEMYLQTRGSHATARTIAEMRSPLAIPLGAWMWDLTATAALIAVVGATFAALGRRAGLPRLAVFAMAVYLFLMLQRNTALSAIMLAWAGLWNLRDLLQRPRWAAALRDSAPAAIANAAVGAVAAAAAWYVASDRYAVRMGLPRESGFGVVEWYQPRGAEAFILEERPAGNLFNIMRDGSYFVWRVSDVLPVYIDGRTDAYPESLLNELAEISAANWDAVAAARGISTAVIPNNGYDDIAAHLLASPDWGLAHLDNTSLVFLRRTPENSPILERREIGPGRPWSWPEDLAERDAVPAWKRLIGGVGRAPHLTGYADSLALAGAADASRLALEAALLVQPGLPRAALALAPHRWAQGDRPGAMTLLSGASAAQRAAAFREAGRLLMDAGQFAAAAEPLRMALDLSPDDTELRIALADAYFRSRDFAKARPEYERALAAGAGANEWTKLGAVCEQLGDAAAATRAYRSSLQLDSAQPAVWNMLGSLAGRTGDLETARRCFDEALRLNPGFEPALRNLQRLNAAGDG